MNDDTAAMNTASPSAVKEKLKLKTRFVLKVMIFPDITAGISVRDRINDAAMKIKARKFLTFVEIIPNKGRIKAPMTGINIILRITTL
jgi:hypothetical protein